MELTKKKPEAVYGLAYEGKTAGGIRLYVGENYGALRIVIDMYHQCDEWEITDSSIDEPSKAYVGLSDFIKDLEEIRAYMLTPRFEEICLEVKNGAI